jgi:hypothetical protein
MYGQAGIIFAKPALEGLTSFMTCFIIEGRGLRLAARTSLLDETVGVVEVDSIGSSETFMRESEGASVDPLGALASLN